MLRQKNKEQECGTLFPKWDKMNKGDWSDNSTTWPLGNRGRTRKRKTVRNT